MAPEQAIEYALMSVKSVPPKGTTRLASDRRSDPLTPREREVASLIAQGLTNREIAAHLVITERTAESHVQHVLDKLGFASRGRIAAWAMEHGLHVSSRS
jgi:non-specific serine/threonine protein kinase